ncbi:MAG: YggT family protein, partial [Candidatus Auribacterota bacterium]|nr:YggT family protein [Candidatus Auribacterota bacterium]
IPDTGQMKFNHPYRFIVKLTSPVVDNLARLMPHRTRRWAPLLGMLLPVIIQGAIYAGGTTIQSRIFDCGITRWVFFSNQAFWGVGKSIISYLVLIYRFYALLLLISLLSPVSSSYDQISRLIKMLLRPRERFGQSRLVSPAVLVIGFALILTLIWKIYQALGWLGEMGMVPLKAGLDSIALLLSLISIIIFLIIVRAVLSWFDSSGRYNGPLFWVRQFSDPFLRPFRRLNLVIGGFDLTPLVAIFALVLIRKLTIVILVGLYPR